MLQVSASELPKDIDKIMDTAQKEAVIVRKNSLDYVAIISMEDYEELIRLKNKRLKNLADEIGYEAREKGLTPEMLEDILNSDD
ncbi:type II toxin-antitoxin system Phd/YefM family antitoxin [Crocosphaera sp.]|uniref:type II toxin-antitoxin system Phd/YefM family antitoxin n=1 Tax=Crocosphaera sp. TaxID=2729996 RepID=UPI002620E6E5|nr:type II toxin-antitoxin system Phd/YefM family antitoxin [Crocosphaera sp.]MDJ0582657.1 type II toxin-antitoxin system Phd/YefM family antitoxin [Crocosphaera sp.]